MRTVILALALGATTASVAAAQGTLGSQGLGYPTGGLSARSFGAGGALADFDPASAVNPAALGQVGTLEIYGQSSLESRRTTVGGVEGTSFLPRFPIAGAVLPLTQRVSVGLGVSTFLERSWGTISETTLDLDGATVVARDRVEAEGAISDFRAAASWRLGPRLTLGAAGHVFTGENRLALSRSFIDAPTYGTFEQRASVDYAGSAVSLGAVLQPIPRLTLAVDGRYGFAMDARQGDSLLAEATVPTRASVAARYQIPGAFFAARVGWERWTDFGGFADRPSTSASTLDARDALDYAVGADVEGPVLFGQGIVLRAGARWRTLPFGVRGNEIDETTFTGGLGVPLAQARILLDLGVGRATRGGVPGVSEQSWVTMIGITMRP